jgi:aryl-alcohol dehydrogenase-like predicted oxidoreductase
VSRICLGTAFRSKGDEATCVAAIEQAADLGCNFIDGANFYREGFSEQIIGKAIRNRREQFVVSTKVGSPMEKFGQPEGLRRDAILKAIEGSLRRLDTDYVDFYVCHYPDPDTPIEETLGALDELVRAGKVRYPGCSRFDSWRLCEALHTGEQHGFAPFVSNQLLYNLIDRRTEDELVKFCALRKISITVFASTAIGLLSGRFRYGRPPDPGTSWAKGPYNYRAAMTPKVDEIVQALIGIGTRHDRTPTQVAMAWCLRQPAVASVIIGADTPERVRENLAAADWTLPDDEWQHLNDLTEGQRVVVRQDCPNGYQPDGEDS